MYFYKSYGLLISSEIELPELSEIQDQGSSTDLKVSMAEFAMPELVKTNIHRRGIRAFFGEDEAGNLFLHWEGVADFKAIGGDLLLISPKTNDMNLLTLFTVSEALGLILFQKGYFLLHASSVKVGSEAWCFMGNPGAGKSTTAAAFIKAGCKLLSDDLTAIKFDETGNGFIIPAYPQLKIWDNTVEGLDYDKTSLSPVSEGVNKFSYQPKGTFEHKPVALKRIFFLHHAKNRAVLKEMNGHEIPTVLSHILSCG